jgi:hypothetical protein
MDRPVFAFVVNTTLFRFLPASSMTKMKYSRHCAVTDEGNKATGRTTIQYLTTLCQLAG